MTTEAVTAASAPQAGSPPPIHSFNEDDGPSFSDVLDILNPLQHIPIINTLYQHLTGDSEGAVADVAGGTLWAGPIGLVSSLIDLSMRSDSGKSASDHLLSWLGLEGDDDRDVAVAQKEQANPANQTNAAAQAVAPAAIANLAAATAAPVPAPRSKLKDEKGEDDKDDTPQEASFMVFGAAGSAQPRAIAQNVAAPANPPAPQDSNIGRQGGYMVFGGQPQSKPTNPAPITANANNQGGYMSFGGSNTPAIAAPVPVQVAQIAPAPAPLPVAPVAPAAAPAAAPPTGLSPLPSHSFAAPARRIQTAPTAIPPPTTGPAAIPGHGPSQAIPLAGDTSWFAQAVNAGLNKYQAAQKLTEGDKADDSATLH